MTRARRQRMALGLALAVLFVLPEVHAQYRLTTPTLTTNAIPATTTNTTIRSSTISVTAGLNVAIQAQLNLADAGTTAIVLKFDESLDAANWESSAHSVTITPNGTNTVTTVANVALNAIGFLRLSSVENPNSEAIENLVVKNAEKVP